MIDRLYPLDIDGTKQWLLERGRADARHVVLFVYGGPGYPLMIFARAFDTHLLDEFLVVHWDQRHSGKSFDPLRPPLRFTLEPPKPVPLRLDGSSQH